MASALIMGENWDTLISFFPENWKKLAKESGAVTRLRDFKSEESLMRTLLLHIANGYSLRETVVVAKAAGWAEVSDVAILRRLRHCEKWFQRLCGQMVQECQLVPPPTARGYRMRLVDATVVKEPGKTGSQWKIHFSIELPSLTCDFFSLKPLQGEGNGESLSNFPVKAKDCLLGDRAYSSGKGMDHVLAQGGRVIVRMNTGAGTLTGKEGGRFDLLKALKSLDRTGDLKDWAVHFKGADDNGIAGRVCAIRKTEHAAELAIKHILKEASKRQRQVKPETLEYAKYVLVFTTLPALEFSAAEVLEWYRLRWQIELLFKRLKSLAGLGHLPKHDPASSRAWLYGKLFVGLLTQKLIHCAESFSPWGYCLEERAATK
jgi:hypothetical protein